MRAVDTERETAVTEGRETVDRPEGVGPDEA